jgi:hypothetical protein
MLQNEGVSEIQLLDQQNYYLEGKVSGGPKERIIFPFEICIEILTNPSSREYIKEIVPETYKLLSEVGPIFPVAATEWLRTHYVLNGENRATIDTQLKYFGFLPGSHTNHIMGEINRSRLEFKNNNVNDLPLPEFQYYQMEPIPPKWHEETIRSMYIKFLSNKTKTI